MTSMITPTPTYAAFTLHISFLPSSSSLSSSSSSCYRFRHMLPELYHHPLHSMRNFSSIFSSSICTPLPSPFLSVFPSSPITAPPFPSTSNPLLFLFAVHSSPSPPPQGCCGCFARVRHSKRISREALGPGGIPLHEYENECEYLFIVLIYDKAT